MNINLRRAYRANVWSYPSGFLEYLREQNWFTHMAGQQKANPYWWGVILEFNCLENVIGQLIENKSIKIKRLKEFAEFYENDGLSPIVKLTGMTIQRLIKNKT